jgi:hypothetical protein
MNDNNNIKTSLALNKNNIIHIDNANKDIHTNLKCLGCVEDLIIKDGEIKTKHYCHKTSNNNNNCSNDNNNCSNGNTESEIHKIAKFLTKVYLDEGKIINVAQKCKTCPNIKIETKTEDLKVIHEYSYKNENNIERADIALLKKDEVFLIIEIKNTHVTLTRKYKWVEFEAKEVITNITSHYKNNAIVSLTNIANCGINHNHLNMMPLIVIPPGFLNQILEHKDELLKIAKKLGYYLDFKLSEQISVSTKKVDSTPEKRSIRFYVIQKYNSYYVDEYKQIQKIGKCLCCYNHNERVKKDIYKVYCFKCYKEINDDGFIEDREFISVDIELRKKYLWLKQIPEINRKEVLKCLICDEYYYDKNIISDFFIWFYGYRQICTDCINKNKTDCYNILKLRGKI